MKKYYGLGMLLAVATTLFGGCEQKVIEDSVALDVQAQESENQGRTNSKRAGRRNYPPML